MTVGKAIYYLLTNATGVTDVVSTRIYPEVAQQDADLPFIVYAIANNEPTDTKPEPSKLDTAQVEVNIYSQSYTECIDLAVAVRAALDRVKGTYNGVNVQSIQYLNEVIDFDEPQRAYNINADYDVRISRSGFEIAQGSPITGVQLGELSDVDVTGVTNGQLIAYNDATGNWEAADDAGGPDVLDDLSDVDAGSPSAGQLLSYGQGQWTTIEQDELTLPIGSVSGLQTELNTIPDNINDLDDVKIVGTPSEGDALVYQSGFWSRGTAGAATLDELDDVQVPTPSSGAVLQYNGTYWAASALSIPSVPNTYYHQRYSSEAGTLRSGATETVELYYTAQADGDGLSESASSDTPTSGYDIRRKLWYAEKAQADPDTSGDWTQFTAIADNTTFANAKTALLAYLKERTGGTVPISLKMTWEEVAQAPSFTGLLNESYGSGAEAAYSTRRLNGNVTDCMVIRRASDSTTQTIGFDGSGNIDEAAINTFCSGTSCTVYQWLDQSGSGNTATAAASGNEPTIYTGGALVKENGKVALDFDGSGDCFDVSAFGSALSLPNSTFTVAKADTTGTFYLYGGASGTENTVRARGLTSTWEIGNPTFQNTGIAYDTNTHLFTGIHNASATLFVDGNSSGALSGAGSQSWQDVNIGSRYGDFTWNGKQQEFIIYNSDKSGADQASIEENIGDYFTQNTPLLDTYSGAAAAYSLRLLDSSYVGSAVEVYNGSSYADIGFNVFGELDTVALAAHCGSNNGFVSKWYDQAGSNDATQTVTGSMPKIYDGTTGVLTVNGKPTIQDNNDAGIKSLTTSISSDSLHTSNEFTCIGVFQGDSNGRLYFGTTSSAFPAWAPRRFSYDLAFTPTQQIGGTSLIDTQTIGFLNRSGNTVASYLNNTAAISSTDTANITTATVTDFPIAQMRYGTFVQEYVIWNSDKLTDRTDIQDNLNNFYSAY